MKRLLLFIIASGFCLGTALATLEVSSSSYNVQSGQAYQASLSYGVYDGGSATLSKLNSSGWHWLADGWGSPFVDLSAWTSDTGSQTVEIWGEGWDDTWGEYESNMVEVVVGGASNTPPVPSVVVDGYSHGATVTRPAGGSVNVTVRFRATDANGNLTGIRPQVWDPAGNLNNNNGSFVSKSGSSGEVAWTVTLNQNGNWYFWTDAQDATIAPNSVSSGQWASGFRLNVVEAAPVPAITSATAVSGSIASACSYQITATNSPTSYTASGLPAGLTLNTASGLVSGTPTTAGVYVATVGAVNAHGTGTAQVTFSIGSGWASTVQSGYAYSWGAWQTAHFNLANAAINNSSAPAPAKADAQAVLSQISADAGIMSNYTAWVYKDYAVGVATGSASFERDPEMGIYSIYLTVSWPDHPLPVTFTFGNLRQAYDGQSKTATVVANIPNATYTADLTRGPAAGSYTVTATATGAYSGSGSATLVITTPQAALSLDPSTAAVVLGQSQTFTAVGGNGTGAYSWGGAASGTSSAAAHAVTFQALGSHTVTVFRQGDSTYADSNTASATVTVSKATPVGTFASRSFNPMGISYTVQAGDLNAVFANPHSASVAQPVGTVTYTLGEFGAPITVGTVLNVGATYTIRARYPGDENYQASFVDTTWTIVAPDMGDDDSDGLPNYWENYYFLNNPEEGNPDLDSDNDGLNNMAEFNLGTDPMVYTAGTATLGGGTVVGWPEVPLLEPTPRVGMTSGTLQVDKNGAATYSIPLWVTPGTAGMQPQLSLNYSSQAGPGMLGYGWSLGGVSMITRGGQTFAVDGQVKGMNFTDTDRFYLDGQRLIAFSGTYGADGTEYRTEIDSISKIVSYGSGVTGPSWFKVWTKAGLIIEFGNTDVSAVNAQGRDPDTMLSWAVSKISDTAGNYMTFEYAEDTVNGEHRLTRINYTGNGSMGTYASVRIAYESRSDVFSGYVAGSKIARTQRITSIASYFGETKAREYVFTYVNRPNTNRSILTAITEKGEGGVEYPPLVFAYETPSSGWTTDSTISSTWWPPAPLIKYGDEPRGTGFVDFNGDGLPDFVQFRRAGSTDTRASWKNTVTGWVAADGTVPGIPDYRLPAPLATDGSAGYDNGSRIVDVNGDGLPDFFDSIRFHINTGAGFEASSVWDLPEPPPDAAGYLGGTALMLKTQKATFIDFDGDGRVDLIAKANVRYLDVNEALPPKTESHSIAWRNTGDGWELVEDYYPRLDMERGSRFVDVNGDGLPDQVQHWRDQGTILKGVAINAGDPEIGWYNLSPSDADFERYLPPVVLNQNDGGTDAGMVGTELVDLNGDGLTDLVHRYYSGSSSAIPGYPASAAYLNTGNGWVLTPNFEPPYDLAESNAPRGASFLDVNADGLPDAVYAWDVYGRGVRLNTGTGWVAPAEDYNLKRQLAQSGRSSMGADMVDLNGDGVVDQAWHYVEGSTTARGATLNLSRSSDRLVSVTNGFGVTASLTYAPLTERDSSGNPTIYTKGITVPNSDTVNVTGPMWVVKTVTHEDGTGGNYDLHYTYHGLRAHRLRGSLGFEWMEVRDGRTGIISNTAFSQIWPFIGMPVDTETRTSTGRVLSTSTVTYKDKHENQPGAVRLPYAEQSVESSYDLATGDLIVTTTTTTQIDTDGNVTSMTTGTSDGYSKTTANLYDLAQQDIPAWHLGRLTQSTVKSSATGKPTITRVSAFSYDPNTGLLLTETVEPGTPTLALKTTYGYDQFGNKTSVAVSGVDLTVDANGDYIYTDSTVTRTTTTQFDDKGRFPIWTQNAREHKENYTSYNQALGVLLAMTGANDLPTSWTYDAFGGKLTETRADGTETFTRRRWAPPGSPAGAHYYVETRSSGGPPSLTYFDKFGREIRSMAVNGDGRIVLQDTAYDNHGRAYAKSNPYFVDALQKHWSQTISYDLLNRPLVTHTPADADAFTGTNVDGTLYVETHFAYAGLVSTATDPQGRVSRTEKNSQGWTISNSRNHTAIGNTTSSTVTYGYDAIGNLISTDAEGSVITLIYDGRGRKITMGDPDMGAPSLADPNIGPWQYRYNIFGELIWQRDAKLQVVTLSYDELGRLIQRVEPEGTTTWTYDTADRTNASAQVVGVWKGKLASVASPGGYLETYVYDHLGRPSTTWRTIPGSSFSPTEARYFVTQTYDSFGRPATTIYPTQFRTRNVYNEFGYLKEVREYEPADNNRPNAQLQGRIFWMADSYAVTGQINGERYGNGLTNDRVYSAATGRLGGAAVGNFAGTSVQYLQYLYDAVGNVLSREDGATNRDETFTYDALDRLLTHTLSIDSVAQPTISVTYDSRGNIKSKSDVGNYNYSNNPGYRPHVLISNIGGPLGTKFYAHDANGNRTNSAGRTFTWTSFNQLQYVATNGTGQFSEFTFGANRERVKQTSHLGTTTYIGALFERFTPTGSGVVTEDKHYIYAPTGRVAVHTQRSNLVNETHWFHTDGLGSITAVSNAAGSLVKRFAFDAWGKRVDAATNSVFTTNAATGPGSTGGFTRGYTDHEQLDDLGLIHMNGRVYDPVLGRFLSADPHVDDASDAQGFNRYSYVGNNPMNATDPSGYFKLKDGLKIVAIVAAAVVGAMLGQYYLAGYIAKAAGAFASTFGIGISKAVVMGIAGGIGGGFASGFAGSLLNGGSLGDAFKAGVVGGIAGGITGGLLGWVGGQNYNWFERGLAHGVIQGGAAEATGGEFRHGFYAGFAVGATEAGIGEWAGGSKAKGIAGAAAIGGTAAAIGGGKFANGAVTGAFSYLFNYMSSRSREVVKSRVYHVDEITPLSEWYVREGAGFAISDLPDEISTSTAKMLEDWAQQRSLGKLARLSSVAGKLIEGFGAYSEVRDAFVRYDQPIKIRRSYFVEYTTGGTPFVPFSSRTYRVGMGEETFVSSRSVYVPKTPLFQRYNPIYIQPVKGGYLMDRYNLNGA